MRGKRMKRSEDGLCIVEGCSRQTADRAMCGPHYYRHKKYGDALGGPPPRTMVAPGAPCSEDGCGSPSKVRGLCSKHYRVWLLSQEHDGIDRRGREKAYARKWKWLRKEQVFDHYGWECRCCGECQVEFLVIDHVDNDGAEHRRTMSVGGDSIYRWLVSNGFPEGFQVLCHNCNWAKQTGGCPHILMAHNS